MSWHSCFLGPDPMRLETLMVTLFKANTSLYIRSDLLFFFFFFSLFPAPKILKKFIRFKL